MSDVFILRSPALGREEGIMQKKVYSKVAFLPLVMLNKKLRTHEDSVTVFPD